MQLLKKMPDPRVSPVSYWYLSHIHKKRAMDRDSFIIAVFLTVCNQYDFIKQKCKIRRGGFPPTPSDEEVIAMEICGKYFKIECDKDIFSYFHAHYRHFFPKLADRSLFVRQAANLWQIKAFIQKLLTVISGEINNHVQSIDTFPLPVCVITRSGRDRRFQGEGDYGCCPTKDMHYYGFKSGLRISTLGMIPNHLMIIARPHDIQYPETLLG